MKIVFFTMDILLRASLVARRAGSFIEFFLVINPQRGRPFLVRRNSSYLINKDDNPHIIPEWFNFHGYPTVDW